MTIALATLRESIRSKVLYLTLFFGAALVLITTLFGAVTVGDQVRVIKDFGLFSISLCTIGYAVIAGSTLLYKELARKTIYTILSKPVRRGEFLLGKFFGMLATSTVMLILLGAGLSGYIALFEHSFDPLLIRAYLCAFFELTIVCGAAIFFSSVVVTPLLSGIFTFALFLAGRSVEYLLYFTKQGEQDAFTSLLLTALYWILPHLSSLTVANRVVYGEAVLFEYLLYSGMYTFGYTTLLLLFSFCFFQRRDFN